MRVAAIFGLHDSMKSLRLFQRDSPATWTFGLPATADDASAVLIFGGDGTIHRHLAQLVKLRLPLLVVPRGSGNDFARALKIRSVRDALDAWRSFAAGAGNTNSIDLGVIAPVKATSAADLPQQRLPHSQYFCCVGGVGLDAEINRRANLLPRWLRTHAGYALCLPSALLRFVPTRIKISVSQSCDARAFVTRSDTTTMVAAFANAPAYGGGMKIAPNARLDDGKLEVCVVSGIGKSKLLCLFPTIYFGRHLRLPQVDSFQVERLRLETECGLEVYADGEYVCQTPIEVSVAPRALTVIVPCRP
jgi:diacylglycerol kinase (ATP)